MGDAAARRTHRGCGGAVEDTTRRRRLGSRAAWLAAYTPTFPTRLASGRLNRPLRRDAKVGPGLGRWEGEGGTGSGDVLEMEANRSSQANLWPPIALHRGEVCTMMYSRSATASGTHAEKEINHAEEE